MTVDIAAGAAQDGAANPSAAAVPFSIDADLTPVGRLLPVIGVIALALALLLLVVGARRRMAAAANCPRGEDAPSAMKLYSSGRRAAGSGGGGAVAPPCGEMRAGRAVLAGTRASVIRSPPLPLFSTSPPPTSASNRS